MKKETVDIKDYVDILVASIREAVSLAYASMEKRLDGMNEFRDTLKDQAGRFVNRDEMEAKLEIIRKDVLMLQKIVWMGMGGMVVLQLLLKFVI